MNEKINIVLSGVGNRALPKNIESSNWLGWVELIKKSGLFQLVAAHDVSSDALKRLVDRGYINPSQAYHDLDKMLEEVKCDAIVIANPAEYHASAIKKALEKGIHLLVEKPFVNSLTEGKELLDLIEIKGTVVSVVQNWRTKDVGRLIKESIQSGMLGNIGHIFFRYVRDRENPNYPAYIFEEEYPLLYAMGIHHLDLFRYILQDEYETVSGYSFKPPWSLYKSETGVNLFLRTKKGVTIVYTGTISSKNKVIPQESFLIEGEKGSLLNESQWSEPPLWFYPSGKSEKIDLTEHFRDSSTAEQYNRSDEYILRNFYNSILGREKPICSAKDSLLSVAILEASSTACETRKIVYPEEYLK